MGELNRAFAAVRQQEPDAESRLYATIRARVVDDVLERCEPLFTALNEEGRQVTAAWLTEILLDARDDT